MTIAFRVYGKPKPGGSKRGFVVGGHVNIVEASNNKDWKEAVKQAAIENYDGPLLAGPLRLMVDFSLLRPKGHYGLGRNANKLKPSAPLYPDKRPDTSKLVRSTEDALTGILWRDDAQIVEQRARKLYCSTTPRGREGALITVETMDGEAHQ